MLIEEREKKVCTDVSLVSESIAGRCKWETWEEMSSYHKPIMIESGVCKRDQLRTKLYNWAWKKAKWNIYKEEVKKESERCEQYVSVNRVVINKDDKDKRKQIARRMTQYLKSLS